MPFYPPMDPKNQNFQKDGKNIWRYYHFTKINDSHLTYGSLDMECNGQNVLSFWTIFCLNIPKNKNLERMKKTPGYIIILNKCTKDYDQMMYSSWDIVRDRCNCYFSFWAIFCPLTPLSTQKIKILKKFKKRLEISSFYIYVPKIVIGWCTVPDIWCVTYVIIFYFGAFFVLLPP